MTLPQVPSPPLSARARITREVQVGIEDAWTRARRALAATPAATGARTAALLCRLGVAQPARALALVRKARLMRRRSAFLAQAEAVLTARTRGWEAAAPLFEAPVARARPGAALGVLRGRPTPGVDLALPAADRPATPPPEIARGIVIYTTAFGAEPPPAPLFQTPGGVRRICFTDRRDLDVPGWETAPPPQGAPDAGADPVRTALWARILPHRLLERAAPGAEASLYLAPDRWLVGNVDTLLARWLIPHDLVLWRHEGGIDWRDLAEHGLIAGIASPRRILAQARDCAARDLPRDRGAWDAGVIWRRHAAAGMAKLGEAWWAEAETAPGLPAIGLYAALHAPRTGAVPRPRLMPAALGRAGDNAFAALRPPAPVRPAATGRVLAGRPAAVAILYAEDYAASASTFLRGRQLANLVRAHDPDGVDMLYTSDLAALRDRVVVVTKGALEVHSAEALADLAARNIAVLGSWDDVFPEPDKVAVLTGSMTLSNRQTTDFARLFPDRPAFHVTHHVNTQVRATTPPMDRPRTGYFGLLRNTHRPESLAGLVDLIGIATASVEMSWLDALPRYNCHWIVRRRGRAHDGWKPFLKGFLAARCNAVVVTGRGDDDALQYLGDDYPFYVRGLEPATLEYDMMEIAAAFGGPRWRLAREIMAQVAARSTDAVVVAEFRAMVRAVSA